RIQGERPEAFELPVGEIRPPCLGLLEEPAELTSLLLAESPADGLALSVGPLSEEVDASPRKRPPPREQPRDLRRHGSPLPAQSRLTLAHREPPLVQRAADDHANQAFRVQRG